MIRPGLLTTENESVTLRRLMIDDAQEYFGVIDANRGHLSRFGEPIASNCPDIETVRALIVHPYPENRWQLGIWDDESFVGMVNLASEYKTAMIDYWLAEDKQGKGYATLAVSSLAEFASSKFYTIQALVKPENNRSIRVLARSGFMKAATYTTDQGSFKLFRYMGHHESEQLED
jgi:RimJ/RimL family protein N-acetyltransferase